MTGVSLKTQNLTLQSPNRLLLAGLNLQASPGQIWGILGKNGVGKSTLLHALCALREPVSGQIFINNQELEAYS